MAVALSDNKCLQKHQRCWVFYRRREKKPRWLSCTPRSRSCPVASAKLRRKHTILRQRKPHLLILTQLPRYSMLLLPFNGLDCQIPTRPSRAFLLRGLLLHFTAQQVVNADGSRTVCNRGKREMCHCTQIVWLAIASTSQQRGAHVAAAVVLLATSSSKLDQQSGGESPL